MSKIEDILYEAHEGGFHDEIIDTVRELNQLDKNKHRQLSDIYEDALNVINNKDKKTFEK